MSNETICLSRLFAPGALLADRDGDGLPDAVRARLVLGAAAGLPEHQAAIEIAARLGFETLALALPLVVSDTADLPDDTVAVFVGRPATLPPTCPAPLRAAAEALETDMGLVATAHATVLVAGADAAGLADAARFVAAYLPASATDSAAALPLLALQEQIGALCGVPPAVEALVTRAGRLTEVRLRVHTSGAALADLTARIAAPTLPCDLTIIGDAADDAVPPIVQIAATQPLTDPTLTSAPAMTAVPPLRSLAELYGPTGFAVDTDGDLLPDRPRTRLLLPDDLSTAEAAEVVHLAARLGLESLGLCVPLVLAQGSEAPESGQVIVAIEPLGTAGEGSDGGHVRLTVEEGVATLRVGGGSPQGRAMALRALADLDAARPLGRDEPTLIEAEKALQRLFALADPDAWACAAIAAARQLPDAAIAPSPDQLRLSIELPDTAEVLRTAVGAQIDCLVVDGAPGLAVAVEVGAAEERAAVINESHRLTWEVDDLWQSITDAVMPALTAAHPDRRDWSLDLRVSEPDGRRRQIKGEVLRQLRATGMAADDEQVRVLPAYHQGRAWLLEEVAPRLLRHEVATVTVRVQRFTRDYPCLELPIRWLQDLHTVDELLGARLGLPHQAIRFELAEIAHTYEVEAHDGAGALVVQTSLDVVHGQRPYLAGFAEWGTVHPPTGCVRLLIAGQAVVDRLVAPDPERVWDLVQAALLPRLHAHILAVTDGVPRIEEQPFFGALTVEAWLSEEDGALGVREERVSPLESLHEDLYFMLLDYCCAVTVRSTGGGEPYLPPWVRPRAPGESAREPRLWMAPGRIVPYIHRSDGGAGRVQLTLTAAPGHRSHLAWRRGAATGTLPLSAAPECLPRIVGVQWSANQDDPERPQRRVVVQLDGPEAACAQAMALLAGWAALRATGTAAGNALPDAWAFSIHHAATVLQIDALPAPHGEESVQSRAEATSNEPVVPWDRVLGLAEVERAVHSLAALPGVHAYRAGRSARGRASYAIEVTTPRTEGIWSRARLSTWKCTLLLNARHHANEASSTSAVLRLVSLLAGDEEWRHFLNRVNVVIIPYENPDGAALHDTLQQEHPTWMHHAGRYNDAGLEFVAEYANPLTRHTEALVMPRLWHAWAPDIVCDDHGFPSHEWIQPFAGHSNPWFQSHWIAQGLIYLILPRITNPVYAAHARASDEVRRRMVRLLADDGEVRARNSSYADRYRTFLSDWLPEAFPAPFEEDILVHQYDHDPDDRARHRTSLAGVAAAYPGVTTLSLITEVADETAQGRYMALCAHTHLLANRALLEYLYAVDAPAAVRRERQALPQGGVLLRAVRPRPVQIG